MDSEGEKSRSLVDSSGHLPSIINLMIWWIIFTCIIDANNDDKSGSEAETDLGLAQSQMG